jgi:hypothetical protein
LIKENGNTFSCWHRLKEVWWGKEYASLSLSKEVCQPEAQIKAILSSLK